LYLHQSNLRQAIHGKAKERGTAGRFFYTKKVVRRLMPDIEKENTEAIL